MNLKKNKKRYEGEFGEKTGRGNDVILVQSQKPTEKKISSVYTQS